MTDIQWVDGDRLSRAADALFDRVLAAGPSGAPVAPRPDEPRSRARAAVQALVPTVLFQHQNDGTGSVRCDAVAAFLVDELERASAVGPDAVSRVRPLSGAHAADLPPVGIGPCDPFAPVPAAASRVSAHGLRYWAADFRMALAAAGITLRCGDPGADPLWTLRTVGSGFALVRDGVFADERGHLCGLVHAGAVAIHTALVLVGHQPQDLDAFCARLVAEVNAVALGMQPELLGFRWPGPYFDPLGVADVLGAPFVDQHDRSHRRGRARTGQARVMSVAAATPATLRASTLPFGLSLSVARESSWESGAPARRVYGAGDELPAHVRVRRGADGVPTVVVDAADQPSSRYPL